MSTSYIAPALRQRIADAANHCCSYCQTQAALIGRALQIDHILPEACGGSSAEENLCLACSTCNQKKGKAMDALDPLTGARVPLYNPRQQIWHEHFQWDSGGRTIIGRTAVGRATIQAFEMNNPYIVRSRQLWVEWGVHPPLHTSSTES